LLVRAAALAALAQSEKALLLFWHCGTRASAFFLVVGEDGFMHFLVSLRVLLLFAE